MISDRRLPKHKGGLGLKLTVLMFLSLVVAIGIQIAGYNTDSGADASFILFSISLGILIIHIITGPTMCAKQWSTSEDQIEIAVAKTLDIVDSVLGIQHESE